MFKSWLKRSLLLSSFYRVHSRARAPVYENEKESWWTFRRRHVWYLVEATTSIKTEIIFWLCHFVNDLVHSRACSHVDWKMTTVKNNIQWVCHVHKRMSQNEAPILFQGCILTQPWWRKDYSKRNLLESKVESWLGKKPKGHLDNSMWAGKMQAHLLNLLHILKKLVSDFEHFPRTRLRISTLTLFGVFCQNPIFWELFFGIPFI